MSIEQTILLLGTAIERISELNKEQTELFRTLTAVSKDHEARLLKIEGRL